MPGVPINDGNDVRAPRYLDLRQGKIVNGKSVPYDSDAEILTAVPDSRKADGLPFYVRNGDKVETWRLKWDGVAWVTVKDSGGGGGSITFTLDADGSYDMDAGDIISGIIVDPESDLASLSIGTTAGGNDIVDSIPVVGSEAISLMLYAKAARTIYFTGITSSTKFILIKNSL